MWCTCTCPCRWQDHLPGRLEQVTFSPASCGSSLPLLPAGGTAPFNFLVFCQTDGCTVAFRSRAAGGQRCRIGGAGGVRPAGRAQLASTPAPCLLHVLPNPVQISVNGLHPSCPSPLPRAQCRVGAAGTYVGGAGLWDPPLGAVLPNQRALQRAEGRRCLPWRDFHGTKPVPPVASHSPPRLSPSKGGCGWATG